MAKNHSTRSADVTETSDRRPVQQNHEGSLHRDRLYIVIAALVAALLRFPSYFAQRHLTFDDGVFASSVIAMRDGGIPFRDVFSSQGPLFLPLAYLGDLMTLRGIDSPRTVGIISGVALTIFVYLALSRMTDHRHALYGALIVATSGCVMWVSSPIASDGPALAFAAAALWVAMIHLEDPTRTSAVATGLLVGASLSIKAMNVPLLAPVGLILLVPVIASIRSGRFDVSKLLNPFIAALTALTVFIVVSVPFGLSNVWDQVFTYRTESLGDKRPVANLRKILSTLWDRDLVLWLLVLMTLLWVVIRYIDRRNLGRGDQRQGSDSLDVIPDEAAPINGRADSIWLPSPLLLMSLWLVLTFAWLVIGVNPMWRSHVSAVVVPAAMVLALCAPPEKWLAVVAIACVPLVAFQLDGLLMPGPYKGSEREVVQLLKSLPAGSWALSDEPGLVWRAGLRTTDNLVDPSMLRVQAGRYDENTVVTEAADPHVCAVVVRSKERFGSFPGLGARLSALGYLVAQASTSSTGDQQRVYVKADCSPPD